MASLLNKEKIHSGLVMKCDCPEEMFMVRRSPADLNHIHSRLQGVEDALRVVKEFTTKRQPPSGS